MRAFILATALILAPIAASHADEFLVCSGPDQSAGPYGDGTASGELFAIYAAEINPEVLVYPEDEFDAAPGGFDTRSAEIDVGPFVQDANGG